MKFFINRQPNRESVFNNNELINDDFEENLTLLEEWFTMSIKRHYRLFNISINSSIFNKLILGKGVVFNIL